MLDRMKRRDNLAVEEALTLAKELLARASRENVSNSHALGTHWDHSDGSLDHGNEAERHRRFIKKERKIYPVKKEKNYFTTEWDGSDSKDGTTEILS